MHPHKNNRQFSERRVSEQLYSCLQSGSHTKGNESWSSGQLTFTPAFASEAGRAPLNTCTTATSQLLAAVGVAPPLLSHPLGQGLSNPTADLVKIQGLGQRSEARPQFSQEELTHG